MCASSRKIASGSSDSKVIIWNVLTGQMVREMSFHTGPVTCIIRLGENRMCSGGSDRTLFVWDGDGFEVGKIERQENENLHCMLSIGNRIVTGSSSSLLLVYNPDSWSFVTILAYHRESVTCLERLTHTHFASGSLDGSIVVWHADTLKPSKILSFPEKYRSDFDHQYIFHVRSLAQLNQRFLAASIGNGFAVYDLQTGEKVLDKPDAHEAACVQVLPLYKGRKIATCSDDGTIKLWGPGPEMDLHMAAAAVEGLGGVNSPMMAAPGSPLAAGVVGGGGGVGSGSPLSATSPVVASSAAAAGVTPASTEQPMFRGLFGAKKKVKALAPVLLGEMVAHMGGVNALARINQTSFISVSSDMLAMLWRDGLIQQRLRDNLAIASLLVHSKSPVSTLLVDEVADPLRVISLTVSEDHVSPSVSPPPVVASPRNTEVLIGSGTTLPTRGGSFGSGRSYSVDGNEGLPQVPSYILTFAHALKSEKRLTTAQVLVHLEEQGHSKQLIEAVRLTLGE